MKTNRILGVIISLVLQCTVVSAAFATPFSNGDFASGFAGWQGEVMDIFGNTAAVDPPHGGFPDNFDAATGAAVLTTSTLADDIFSVALFQTFELPTVVPGETLRLSYQVAVVLSDPDPLFGDLAFAQIADVPGLSNVVNLLGASSQDITALAGQTVELLFAVQDFDGGLTCSAMCDDILTIDNITIDVIAVSTPAPASLGLLALALIAMGVGRRRLRVHNPGN